MMLFARPLVFPFPRFTRVRRLIAWWRREDRGNSYPQGWVR